MSSPVKIILYSALAIFAAIGLVVRQRARRMGDGKTERRLQFVSLGAFLLFFGYRVVVTDDTVTRLFNGVSVLVVVARMVVLRNEQPRV